MKIHGKPLALPNFGPAQLDGQSLQLLCPILHLRFESLIQLLQPGFALRHGCLTGFQFADLPF